MSSEKKLTVDERHYQIDLAFSDALETYREKIWDLAVDAAAENITSFASLEGEDPARVEFHIGLSGYDYEGITKDFGEYLSDEVDDLISEVIHSNGANEWETALFAFSQKLEELSVRINKALREAEA